MSCYGGEFSSPRFIMADPYVDNNQNEINFLYEIDGVDWPVAFSEKKIIDNNYYEVKLDSSRVKFVENGSPIILKVYKDSYNRLSERGHIRNGNYYYFLKKWAFANDFHERSGMKNKVTVNFDFLSTETSRYSFRDSTIYINGPINILTFIHEMGHAWHHSVLYRVLFPRLKNPYHSYQDDEQSDYIVAWEGIANFALFEYFSTVYDQSFLSVRFTGNPWYSAYIDKKRKKISLFKNELLFGEYLSKKYSFGSLENKLNELTFFQAVKL